MNIFIILINYSGIFNDKVYGSLSLTKNIGDFDFKDCEVITNPISVNKNL